MKESVRKNTHLLGAHFENLAVEYLQAKGYSILERNARYHHLETDIIAMDGDYLCFIEVKGRKKNSLTQPLEALNRRKISFLRTMAEAYLGFLSMTPPAALIASLSRETKLHC